MLKPACQQATWHFELKHERKVKQRMRHAPEVALVHVGGAERGVVVEPVAVAQTLHLLAQQPRALVKGLQLSLWRHLLAASTPKQHPLHGHGCCVPEAVVQHPLESILLRESSTPARASARLLEMHLCHHTKGYTAEPLPQHSHVFSLFMAPLKGPSMVSTRRMTCGRGGILAHNNDKLV